MQHRGIQLHEQETHPRTTQKARTFVLLAFSTIALLGGTVSSATAGTASSATAGTGSAVAPGTGSGPPMCSVATASPSSLWPPNHKMVLVTIGGVTDPDGDPVTVTITGVTQDEPLNGLGDGDTSPDAQAGPSANTVNLRAERSGTGDGRVYRLAFTGSDGKGGTCTGVVTVGVPHDQGPQGGPVDSGLVVNSFGP